MSVSQMLQPTWPCAGVALGAAASHWLSAPDFVGLDMAAGRPAQPVERHHALHRIGDQRKQRALAVVEQQRLVGIDQELVEGESRRPDLGQEGRQAIDLVGDLGDFGFHGFENL